MFVKINEYFILLNIMYLYHIIDYKLIIINDHMLATGFAKYIIFAKYAIDASIINGQYDFWCMFIYPPDGESTMFCYQRQQ